MSAIQKRCPICGKRADAASGFFPFCSSRCRTQDIANWASGSYAIPVPTSEADEHFEPSPQPYESGNDG